MVKFNEDHKKEMAQGNYFGEGIHKVKMMLFEDGQTEAGKDYLEITVTDDEGDREGTARLWFTTDAAINYSFNTLRGIFTHNAPAGKEQEMKDKVGAIEDSEGLLKACQTLIGKECWYQVSKSDRTYLGRDGSTKTSYDRNIYGYEPTPKATVTTAADPDEKIDLSKGDPNEQIAAF